MTRSPCARHVRRATSGVDARPTLPALTAAPELAVLAALVALLDFVTDALYAAHPELADDERPYWIPTPAAVPLADNLLRRAAGLHRAVARYRLAVTPTPAAELPTSGHDGHDEIPF